MYISLCLSWSAFICIGSFDLSLPASVSFGLPLSVSSPLGLPFSGSVFLICLCLSQIPLVYPCPPRFPLVCFCLLRFPLVCLSPPCPSSATMVFVFGHPCSVFVLSPLSAWVLLVVNQEAGTPLLSVWVFMILYINLAFSKSTSSGIRSLAPGKQTPAHLFYGHFRTSLESQRKCS